MKKLAWALACLCCVACESNNSNDDDGNTSSSASSSSVSSASSSEMAMAIYELELSNVTANQPLSPPLLAALPAGEVLWALGQSASEGLEVMAESGNAAEIDVSSALASVVGDALLLPGQSLSYELTIEASAEAALSVATMLVNTNDAFTGMTGMALGDMSVGDTKQMTAPVWDAGTEANDEAQAHVPGPAGGGEGYNAERNDLDRVSYHPGVVSADDGLSSSVLDITHKFDQGAVTITIHRRQ